MKVKDWQGINQLIVSFVCFSFFFESLLSIIKGECLIWFWTSFNFSVCISMFIKIVEMMGWSWIHSYLRIQPIANLMEGTFCCYIGLDLFYYMIRSFDFDFLLKKSINFNPLFQIFYIFLIIVLILLFLLSIHLLKYIFI